MVINGRLRSFIAISLSDEALEGLKSVQDLIMKTGVVAGFPRISSVHMFRLQGDIEDAMQEIGFEPEKRSFNPHITLARIKSPRNTDILEGMLKEMENCNIGISPVEAVRIYQSILKPDGAVYKVLEEIHSGSRK